MARNTLLTVLCFASAFGDLHEGIVESDIDDPSGTSEAVRLLQSKSQRTAWFELPHASSGMDGFCDADNGMNWDLCGKFSSEEACEAKKSACKWSPGDPFPGFCGVRDDPASEMLCKKNTQPMDCVSSSCQWYRYPMGPGPVQWNH